VQSSPVGMTCRPIVPLPRHHLSLTKHISSYDNVPNHVRISNGRLALYKSPNWAGCVQIWKRWINFTHETIQPRKTLFDFSICSRYMRQNHAITIHSKGPQQVATTTPPQLAAASAMCSAHMRTTTQADDFCFPVHSHMLYILA
jgi:hypothetical protein